MQNIVITGSTRGIGLAMAIAFLKKGCQVTLSGRGEELAPSVKEQLKEFEKSCHYVCCDVTKKDSVENLFEESKKKWGSVEIWINNAGRNTPHVFSWETGKEYTDSVILTNLLGMVYGSQVAAKGMLLQGHGAIYSMEGLGSNKMIQVKTILYGTTKSALTYFMNGLAKELEGTGVIAGRLSPGMMLTDFITKMPNGGTAELLQNKEFKRIFNILADKPETVAEFFIPRILTNRKNNARITWLTGRKSAWRFMQAPFRKNRLI